MKLSRCRAVGLLMAGFIAGCGKQAPPPPSVVLVPAAEKSSHFDAVNRHLELGGSLYGYIDIDGNLDRVAEVTQNALLQLFKTMPALGDATKLQLQPVFRALHLDDLKAVGFSSVLEAHGEYRDRAFLATPDGRHGLLAVVGGPAGTMKHLNLASADTDLYEEIEFDVPALTAAVKQVIIAVKGQAAADEMQQKFEASGAMASVSPLALVRALKGRVTLIVRTQPEKTITIPGAKPFLLPRFAVLLGIDGLGAPLKSLLDKSPFLGMKEDNGRQYYVPKIPMMIDGVRPVLVMDGGDLYLGSDEFFTHECFNRAAGTGLEQNADFNRLITELGPNANTLFYITPRVFEQLHRVAELNPGMDPAAKKNYEVMLADLPIPARPLMSLSQNLPDGVLVTGRLNRSFKPQLLNAVVVVPIAIASMIAQQQHALKAASEDSASAPAPAAPARPRQNLTPDQRVLRNLALLKALSDAYYRRTNTDTAKFEDLVGPGKLIPRLLPAEGEDYSTVHLEKGQPIEVTLPDGRVLKYSPARKPNP